MDSQLEKVLYFPKMALLFMHLNAEFDLRVFGSQSVGLQLSGNSYQPRKSTETARCYATFSSQNEKYIAVFIRSKFC